ncbi:acetyl-CoA synthetase-like protein [Daldinia sp. FL1419]|nr:acetyl-CoA synthetase-like protein [Daldinia sp. FL1419]
MTPDPEPRYGRRLMPLLLDQLADTQPDRVYASVPKSPDMVNGFRDITMAETARCVNYMAWWIETHFGRSRCFETISYIGVSDVRAPILFLAAVKCGYKVRCFLKIKKSSNLLYAVEIAPLVDSIRTLRPDLRSREIPPFEEIINSAPKHYPYEKSFDEARNEPIVVLHSSGSTGLPKPIIMTHGSLAVLDNEKNLPSLPGRKKRDWTMWTWEGEGRLYSAFPFFHLGGFLMYTTTSIFGNTAGVFGPPNRVPDGTLLKEILSHQNLQVLVVPPSIIEQVLTEPNGIDLFKDLEFIGHGGAPFNHASGAKLSEVVELVTIFGSTETYPLPQLALRRDEWAWMEFNPFIKHEMQLFDPDEGTFELVLFADESTKDTTAIYHNLPGVGEYHTKDLFTRHPEKPTVFKYYGRKDDIIVLSNGEKFNPVPFELSLHGHPAVKGALVIGNNRTQAALLIEPRQLIPQEEKRKEFIDELWPYVEKANLLVPGQGRIHPAKTFCALPDRPFARTGKGTIIRKRTEEAYLEEIDKLYSDTLGCNAVVELKLKPLPFYEAASVTEFIRGVLTTHFPPAATIDATDDLFAHGLDSIQTIGIVSTLRRSLQSLASTSIERITPRAIFQNPTIAQLSQLVTGLLNNGVNVTPGGDPGITRASEVDEIVASYIKQLPRKPTSLVAQRAGPSKVAIVGSTGYLGSYLILALLREPGISQIYCLNRSQDARKRQEQKIRELDQDIEPLLYKLKYMKVEIGKPRFGLEDREYQELADEVDTLIYNAWRLDFNLSIQSYRPFLQATVNAIELSVVSKRNIHIAFVSSVSSIIKLAATTTVPEAPVSDPLASLNTGYGQSKHAAERILTAANEISGIPVSVIRVCQLGGPSPGKPGKWVDQAWISGLVRTARTINCIPEDIMAIDWVPIDTAANMIRDFILRPVQREAQFYHISHPKPERWELFVDILRELFGIAAAVPLQEWNKRLRAITDPSPADIAEMPALAILDFFEQLGSGLEFVTYATTQATTHSRTSIPALDKALLRNWVCSWDL